jgi:hypothetical protein
MVILEIVIAMLTLALGIVATAGLYFGLLGCLGVFFHVVHCKGCGHLCITSKSQPVDSCPSCIHPHLLHPLYALHHHDVLPGTQDSSGSAHH